MSFLNKIFKKNQGSFVSVSLDYGFGEIKEGREKAEKGPFTHTLFITDISEKKANEKLSRKRFDWHKIHSHWRYNLEIKGFHAAKWSEIELYLVDWVA